jgi:hypothetical protein
MENKKKVFLKTLINMNTSTRKINPQDYDEDPEKHYEKTTKLQEIRQQLLLEKTKQIKQLKDAQNPFTQRSKLDSSRNYADNYSVSYKNKDSTRI